MLKESLRESFSQIGVALREPEEFAVRWDRTGGYAKIVWLSLGLTAALGTMLYGLTMGIGSGPTAMLTKASLLTFAAGLAWALPLPALYILNSLAGSRLRASTTLLAALVTTSWGGLALIASIPINWFFSVAIPAQAPELFSVGTAAKIVFGVNLLVFAGVGISMVDVFRRVMETLESDSDHQPIWFMALVGLIGSQLFYLFGLFAS
jgi:hypothetical protein